jgi:hypothetical protein
VPITDVRENDTDDTGVVKMLKMTAVMRMLMIVINVFGNKDGQECYNDDMDVNGSR